MERFSVKKYISHTESALRTSVVLLNFTFVLDFLETESVERAEEVSGFSPADMLGAQKSHQLFICDIKALKLIQIRGKTYPEKKHKTS